MKQIHIISGGTLSHIRPHLAFCAPAYGHTGEQIYRVLRHKYLNLGHVNANHIHYHGTKMTMNGTLETNQDVSDLLDRLIDDPDTGMIFMPVALCDFEVFHIDDGPKYDGGMNIGKEFPRLKSSHGQRTLMMRPLPKLINKIRKDRKDIFLVAFKTTFGESDDQMFNAGMNLLKKNSCNLVLVNDIERRQNMILTPEMARYCVTTNRDEVLRELVNMAEARSDLTFHRTNVVDGDLVGWTGPMVPPALHQTVDYCVEHGAYKSFNGATVGHFGFINNGVLYSSRRKKNYNKAEDRDLVKVKFEGDEPTAFGAKPSAGVRSQYELFTKYPEFDCVVHFHCPMKEGSHVNVVSQHDFECGSLECGRNTLRGMDFCCIQHSEEDHTLGCTEMCKRVIAAVMLDKHGPNILFNRDINPQIVIDFIEKNFDLSRSTSE